MKKAIKLFIFAVVPLLLISAGKAKRHKVVADIPNMFCGWCANEGAWSWGREILVGFVAREFEDKGDIVDGHNAVQGAPEYHYLARSRNMGRRWIVEPIPQFDNQDSIISTSFEQFASGQGMDFTNPDFALRCRNNMFWYSSDRGKTWSDPVTFPRFDSEITARTDYIVSGDSCYIFLSAKNKGQDRAFTVLATDNGRSMTNLGWIAPLSLESESVSGIISEIPISVGQPARSVMPATVKCSDGSFVTALRRKISIGNDMNYNWIECFKSEDNCRTWHYLSFVANTDTGTRNGNPPALTITNNGVLTICYGSRIDPYGIHIRTSLNNGQTWSEPTLIRSDGRSWDLGYPKIVSPDGKSCVAIYYIATSTNRKQRIEATLL